MWKCIAGEGFLRTRNQRLGGIGVASPRFWSVEKRIIISVLINATDFDRNGVRQMLPDKTRRVERDCAEW